MKKLILLAFMLLANIFASGIQETICDDKSLSYCINHYDRQCEAKNYNACWFVGGLYREQEQYSEAKKYYEMICDKANSGDSFQVELIDGRMGQQVPVITGMKLSCNQLGKFYYNGWGVRQSNEKAFQYYKKACDLGSGYGCAFVGFAYWRAYYHGEGVKKDLKSSIKFTAKACELKDGGGCFMLGSFYYGGIGVKKNLPKAKELFGKACDLGEQEGCDEYKKLKEKGY